MTTSAVYLETSALLSWLLAEGEADRVRQKLNQATHIVTATLTLLEAERALTRALTQEILDASQCQNLRSLLEKESRRWALLEFTASIRQRAGAVFPVEPVRSLDAIHLASALEANELFDDLSVITLDRRVFDNLHPLGLLAGL